MAIISVVMDFTGEVQVEPRLGRMISTDDLDTILLPGYLNQITSFIGSPFRPTDFLMTSYDFPDFPTQITLGVTIDNDGVISLSLPPGAGNVVSESSADNNGLVIFLGASGTLIDQYGGTGTVYVTDGVVSSYPTSDLFKTFAAESTIVGLQHFLELNGAPDSLAGYGPTGDLVNIGLGDNLFIDGDGDLEVSFANLRVNELINTNEVTWLEDNISTGVVSLPSFDGAQGGRLTLNGASTSGGQLILNPKTGSAASAVLTAGTDVGGSSLQLYLNNGSNVLIGPASTGTGSVSFNFPSQTGPTGYLMSGTGNAQSQWVPSGARYLQTYSPSSVSSIAIPLPSGPEIYELELKAISPANGNANLRLFASNNGGSSFGEIISYVTFGYINASGPFISGGSTTGGATLSSSAGANTGALGITGTVKLWMFTSKVEFICELTWQSAGSTTTACRQVTSGSIQASGVDALRFQWDAGNIASGDILAYSRNS
jgi:hypothetical protein